MLLGLLTSLALAAEPAPQPSWHRFPWLNTERALAAPDLRGRLVLVLFARAGREAELLALDEARRLWSNHPDALIPVLAASGGTALQWSRALSRRGLQLPVVLDDGRLAKAYDVAPPATVLLDWDGSVAKRGEGDRRHEGLAAAVSSLAAKLPPPAARPGLPLKPEVGAAADPLSWVGGLFADAASRRLFVSDSGNRRVIVADWKGRVLDIIGSGRWGDEDGPFETACLQNPSGLLLHNDRLFIADAEGRRVRIANLKSRMLTTLLSPAALGAPWGLALAQGKLFVAAPENRRIWTPGERGLLAPFAGSGAEGTRDGALAKAEFGEPRALLALDSRLLVADIAGPLREIDLGTYEARTLSAGPSSATALALWDGRLHAADVSGRIWAIDPAAGASAVFAEGFSDPTALAALGDALLVADAEGLAWLSKSGARRPFALKGLKLAPAGPAPAPLPDAVELKLEPTQVRADAPAEIRLDLKLPEGWRLNPASPLRYRVAETRGLITYDSATRKGTLPTPRFPLPLRFTAPAGQSETVLVVSLQLTNPQGLARAALLRYVVPIKAKAEERNRVVSVTAEPALN